MAPRRRNVSSRMVFQTSIRRMRYIHTAAIKINVLRIVDQIPAMMDTQTNAAKIFSEWISNSISLSKQTNRLERNRHSITRGSAILSKSSALLTNRMTGHGIS